MNRSNRKFSRSLRKRFYREINDFRTPSDGVVFLVSTSLPQLYHAAIQANIFQKVPFFTLLSDKSDCAEILHSSVVMSNFWSNYLKKV